MDATVNAVKIKEELVEDAEQQGVEFPESTNGNGVVFALPHTDVMESAVTDGGLGSPGCPWKIVDENAELITVNMRDEFYEGCFPTMGPDNQLQFTKPKKNRNRKVTAFVGKCPDCGVLLKGRRIYNDHIHYGLCESKKDYARCEICNYPFPTEQDLAEHMSLHRMNRFFCVKRCSEDFKTYEEVVDHEFRVHEIRKILCNVCNHKFPNGRELIDHMNTKHKNLPRFTCSYCREWCISAKELIEHWRARPEGCGQLMKIMGLPAESPLQKRPLRLQVKAPSTPKIPPIATAPTSVTPTNGFVKVKQEPIDLDASARKKPRKSPKMVVAQPTTESWDDCVEIVEVKQEPIDVDEYMPNEPTGTEMAKPVEVKKEPLDTAERMTVEPQTGRIQIKTEPIEPSEALQTPMEAVVKTEMPLDVVVKTEVGDQQKPSLAIRVPATLKIIPVTAGQASAMMTPLHVPNNIVIRPVPITNMVSIPRNSLNTTVQPVQIVPKVEPAMPKPMTPTQMLMQYRPVKILRLGSNAKIVRLPTKVDPHIVEQSPEPPKPMPTPEEKPTDEGPTKLPEPSPPERVQRKPLRTKIQVRQTPQTINSLPPMVLAKNAITMNKHSMGVSDQAVSSVEAQKLKLRNFEQLAANLPQTFVSSSDGPARDEPTDSAVLMEVLRTEKPVLTVKLTPMPKEGAKGPLTKLKVCWTSLDDQTDIDAGEFRDMIAVAAEKAIDDARQRSLLPSGNEPEQPAVKTEHSSSDSESSQCGKSSGGPSVDMFSSPKVVSISHELSLSLNALDASTIYQKDKLRSVIANAAQIALNEAQRKYSLSRRHIGDFESLPDRQKVISRIMEQIKMAENGKPSYKWDELPLAKRSQPPATADENVMIFEGAPRKMYLAPRRPPPSEDSQESPALSDAAKLPPTPPVEVEEYMFPMSTASDPELLQLRRNNPLCRYVWVCPNCPRRYEQKHSFRAHLVNVHGFSQPDFASMMVPVKAMQCPTAVISMQNSDVKVKKPVEPTIAPVIQKAAPLPVEEPRILGAKPKYECHKCGRQCSSKSMLADHIRGNCSRDPQYPCHLCSKRFFSASTLNCHITVHTGELPHKCNYCDKRFRTRGQVTVHHRTHTGERPFVCQVCDHSFTHRETLISHLSRHIGMKRYKCYGCDKLFSCISGLRTHRSIRPDTCGKVKFNSRAVGPRVRVIRGNVVFEPQPDINPYLRTEDPQEVLAEIQNQQKL